VDGPVLMEQSIAIAQTQADPLSTPALLGGSPAFTQTICVGTPNMPDTDKFLSRMKNILNSKRLTNLGPYVQQFEQQVAELCGTKHCVATCNATLGIELAVSALGIQGDVIVPSFTFVATVHALTRQGLNPIFCDIDPATHCLDPVSVEKSITSRTTGIVGVHLWGNTDSTASLRDIAEYHELKLLFDAAHAFGCGTNQRTVGSFGDAEVLSFHATKFLHSFEGGAIVTDNGELANRLRLMTNFGFSQEDKVEHLATNAKMTEASAAMGLTSLESMQSIVEHNRRNYLTYEKRLAPLDGLSLMRRKIDQPHNYQYIVVDVDSSKIGLTRDELVAALRCENVLARRYFYPGVHQMRPYKGLYPLAGATLPVTEAVCDRVMVLPTGTAVTNTDIEILVERISCIIKNHSRIRAAIRTSSDERLPDFIKLPHTA